MDSAVFSAAAGVSPAVIANFIFWFFGPCIALVAIMSLLSGTVSALVTGSPTRLAIIIFVVFIFVAIITAILA